jgi:hypothetical protein
MSVFMQPIYTATVGAGGLGSVTFNNIPQGFTDLKLVVSSKDGRVSNVWDNILVTFNGSNTGYSSIITYAIDAAQASNTSLVYAGAFSASIGFGLYGSTALNEAATFSNAELTIPNYSGGAYKHVIGESVIPNNSTTLFMLSFNAGMWKNTAPITSITLAPGTGSFAQYSTFTLYGTSSAYAGGLPAAPTLTSVTDEAGFVQVAFTPTANDQASSYAVTSTPSGAVTYGNTSPIDTPATLGTSNVYRVSAVNDRGTSASSNSSAITTENSYASIVTQVSNGSVGQIVFSNIPQNYSHLQLRIFGRTINAVAASQTSGLQINGDGGNNYYGHSLDGNGSSASSGAVNFFNAWFTQPYLPGGNATANIFGTQIIDIIDYTRIDKFKTIKAFGGYDNNGSGVVGFYSGYWGSYSSINSLTINVSGQLFASGSTIALYGIA